MTGTASFYLKEADRIMSQRAALRDTPEGERSMACAVQAFNILTGHNLTETEGWRFMKILKMARSKTGDYNEDDYSDGVAYAALEAESAYKEAHPKDEYVMVDKVEIPDILKAR